MICWLPCPVPAAFSADRPGHEAFSAGSETIRVVASGDVYVRPHVARLLAGSMQRRGVPDARRRTFESLSERERLVVRLMAEGYNGVEIGRQLGISPKTVDTYRSRIEEKLGTRHRVDYVRFALDIELLHR